MRKGLLLMAFSSLLVALVYSQQSVMPGYIIDVKGDTLKGLINYRDIEFNPKTVSFAKTDTAAPVMYRAVDIRGFEVAGNIYVSSAVTVNISPSRLEDLDFAGDIKYRQDTVFLKVLIAGNKSLFYFNERFGKENFYILGDNGIKLLIYQGFKIPDNPYAVIYHDEYITQLMNYLGDCDGLKDEFTRLRYQKTSLLSLFQNYYACKGNEIIYREPQIRQHFDYGLFAGISMTKLEFSGEQHPYLTKVAYPASANFTGGLFFNLVLDKNRQRWSLNNEIQYINCKTSGVYNEYLYENRYIVTSTEFRLSYLKINNMIRYTYPLAKVRAYLELGISNAYVLDIRNYKREENVSGSIIYITVDQAVHGPRKYEQGFILGLGVSAGRFAITYRNEQGNGISEIEGLKSKAMRQYVLLSYNLVKL